MYRPKTAQPNKEDVEMVEEVKNPEEKKKKAPPPEEKKKAPEPKSENKSAAKPGTKSNTKAPKMIFIIPFFFPNSGKSFS